MLSLLCLTTAVALPSRSCVAPPRPLPRRAAFALGAQTLTAALLARPGVARAEGQDPQDFARVGKGLKEVQFLLDNWSKETTNPTSGEMDPDRVRLYLGLRTTSSPLFQFEKLLKAAVNEIPDDRFEDWIAASEGYSSAVAKVNELAFTSSFGEYNPGGGKDQVAKYLELARGEVINCRDALKTIDELIQARRRPPPAARRRATPPPRRRAAPRAARARAPPHQVQFLFPAWLLMPGRGSTSETEKTRAPYKARRRPPVAAASAGCTTTTRAAAARATRPACGAHRALVVRAQAKAAQ